jgi:predicted transporter
MIFFGMLYLLSIVLIPAYLPVHEMNIVFEGFSTEDMIHGLLFAAIMILIGFVIERIKNRRIGWNCSRN